MFLRKREHERRKKKRSSSYSSSFLSLFSPLPSNPSPPPLPKKNRRVASRLDGLEFARHVQEEAQETRRRQAEAAAAAAAAEAAEQHESSSCSSGNDDDEENGNNKKRRWRTKKRRTGGGGYDGDSAPSSLGPLKPWIELERAWQEIEGGMRAGGGGGDGTAPLDPRRVPWPPSSSGNATADDNDIDANDSLLLLAHVAAAARCSLASAWRRTARRYHPDKLGARLLRGAGDERSGGSVDGGSGGSGDRGSGRGSEENASTASDSADAAAVSEALARGAAVMACAAAEWERASRERV